MSAGIIIQARSGSTRFPQKIFAQLAGHSVLWHVIKRSFHAFIPNGRVIVATSTSKTDDTTAIEAQKAGAEVYRGAYYNVLKRYYDAATFFEIDPIIRITGDCPFIDPALVHRLYQTIHDDYDYVCIDAMASYPNGLDAEIFRYSLLADMYRKTQKAKDHSRDPAYIGDREHVSISIKNNNKIRRGRISYTGEKVPKMRLTIDYPQDLVVLQNLADALFEQNPYFGFNEIIDYMVKHPEICELNADLEDLKSDSTRKSGYRGSRNTKRNKTRRHSRYRRRK